MPNWGAQTIASQGGYLYNTPWIRVGRRLEAAKEEDP